MVRAEGSNLLLQGTHPLIQAETLIGTVLNQHGLSPETQTRLTILANNIQVGHDHAAHTLGPVVPTLLNHGPHTLVELVLDVGEGLLAYPQLRLVRDAKDILDKL